MNSNFWRSLYLPLAGTSVVLCVVFHGRISTLHRGVVAGLGIVVPFVIALLGGRLPPEADPVTKIESGTNRRLVVLAVGLFWVACVKFGAIGFLSSGFLPSLHDEWSYLFGAQTIAQGRLTNPTPMYAEFFDAFHVLTSPRWVTRYPPGHPAALALGVVAGSPAAVVIGLIAGTVLWVYLLGREFGGEAVGKLAGVLAIMAPGLDYLASGYLSQSTFLFTMLGCYFCAVRSLREIRPVWAATAGTLGGWAILTRPYSAVAFGLPLGIWFVWRAWRIGTEANRGTASFNRLATVVFSAVFPMAIAIWLFTVYNEATTGSRWQTAWGEYNRQFEPDNTLGFSQGTAQPIPVGMSERKALKARAIAEEKLRFNWRASLNRAVAESDRLAGIIFPAVRFYGLIAFIPFACRTPAGRTESRGITLLFVAAIVGHYLAYSFFYSTWGVYGHETIPFVIILVACGLVQFWRRARESERPAIAVAVPLALLAALVLIGRDIGRFVHRRQTDTKYHREFARKLEGVTDKPAIVFVQFNSTRPHEYDLINNSPGLNDSVLVVLDLGERNSELLAAFPGRTGYVYDEATGTLTLWAPPKQVVPAKWPSHPLSKIASLP